MSGQPGIFTLTSKGYGGYGHAETRSLVPRRAPGRARIRIMPKTKRELDRDIKKALSRPSASPKRLTAAYLNALVASVHPEPLDWQPLTGRPGWMQANFDTDKYLFPYTIGARIQRSETPRTVNSGRAVREIPGSSQEVPTLPPLRGCAALPGLGTLSETSTTDHGELREVPREHLQVLWSEAHTPAGEAERYRRSWNKRVGMLCLWRDPRPRRERGPEHSCHRAEC